ncbi:SAP domain-containing protein [Staphylococcus haemolyticus]|uniref:SAP domain-containing protein n=1 Tax=Staphylococcus haemolyticus TaxID=1283 RepID=UPI00069CDD3C|nr:SAP domain-containing protein [Staphylococcus haemolyticus]MCH4443940.1 SAP domain-containing protein [Staphylococcus haemolyticus]
MKKVLYYFILISSFFMIIGGISKVSQDGLTIPDIFMFIIFISLVVFSIVKLFKHKKLDYKSNKSNNNHKNISNSETTQSKNVQPNNHIKKNNVIRDIETNNSRKEKQENLITNNKTNTLNENKINLNENLQKNNKDLVLEVKDDNNNNNHYSDLNANDILILHLNKNREVGKEVKNHFYLLENQINVDKILNKLINLNFLDIKSNFDVSLPYLKVPELKDILREYKLKLGGNKPELIERVKTNIDENAIELPHVYVPTSKGNEIIGETEYILHFYNSPIISLGSAHKIAKEVLNVDDKIEYIYLYLLQQNQKSNNSDHRAENIINNLVFYYKKTNKNKNVIRKYTNYATYLSVTQGIHSAAFLYSNEENIIDRLFIYFNYHLEYYENMLFIDNISRRLFKNLFYEDIKSFENTDKNFCDEICELLFAQIYNNNNITLNNLPTINYILEKIKNENELRVTKYDF